MDEEFESQEFGICKECETMTVINDDKLCTECAVIVAAANKEKTIINALNSLSQMGSALNLAATQMQSRIALLEIVVNVQQDSIRNIYEFMANTNEINRLKQKIMFKNKLSISMLWLLVCAASIGSLLYFLI